MPERPLVAVVDDDESVRESLPDLLRQLGYSADAFSSAEEFLASGIAERADCLILDVVMPGMSGFELKEELGRRELDMPVILVTARFDPGVRTRAISAGVTACLFKPFSDSSLVDALADAFKH